MDPIVKIEPLHPVYSCHHLPDKQLMIVPNFDVNHLHGEPPKGMTHLQYLSKQYMTQLADSDLNMARCKQYVPKCFYRHPVQSAKNPLVIKQWKYHLTIKFF